MLSVPLSAVGKAELPCFKHVQLVVETPIQYYNKNNLYSMTQRDSDGTSTTSNPFQSDGYTYLHVDRIRMDLSNLYFKGLSVKISLNDVCLFMKIVFLLANSVNPGGMTPYATYHLGLHCLSRYDLLVSRIKRVKPFDGLDDRKPEL